MTSGVGAGAGDEVQAVAISNTATGAVEADQHERHVAITGHRLGRSGRQCRRSRTHALIITVTAVAALERFGYPPLSRSQDTCRLSIEGAKPNISRVVRVR